jgi:hypothetical protein
MWPSQDLDNEPKYACGCVAYARGCIYGGCPSAHMRQASRVRETHLSKRHPWGLAELFYLRPSQTFVCLVPLILDKYRIYTGVNWKASSWNLNVLTGRRPVTLIESFSRACYVRNCKEWHYTTRDSSTQTERTVGKGIHPQKQSAFLQARLCWMFPGESGKVKYKYDELGSAVSPNSSVSVVTRLCV